jgi:glutathione S-transferase
MAANPIVYGAAYSVYVRAVRLTLVEKGVAYDLVEADVFGNPDDRAAQMQRHPFGKIPAFEHDGFRLYESQAIERYVDEAFDGPALQPTDLRRRARMSQALSMLDSYAYPHLVWGVYSERVEKPKRGIAPDEARIAEALAKSWICLEALAQIMGDGPWLAGRSLSLADLHGAPMIDYFRQTPEGAAMLAEFPPLAAWWPAMKWRLDRVRGPSRNTIVESQPEGLADAARSS